MKKFFRFFGHVLLVVCFMLITNNVFAAGGTVKSPTSKAPDRYVYYPGTESLAKDEIRVIACGTGMPSARHGQASTCFLVIFASYFFYSGIEKLV